MSTDEQGFIQLNDTPTPSQDAGTIQLNNPIAPLTVSDNTANIRAAKAVKTMPELGSFKDIYDGMLSGQESDIREKAAALQDTKQQQQKQKFIVAAAGAGDHDALMKAIQQPVEPSDPKSVIEDVFAKSWMNQLDQTSQDNETVWSQFATQQPEQAQLVKTAGSLFAAQKEYIRKNFDDVKDIADTQSWPSYLADEAKQLFTLGLYKEFKMRGNLDVGSKYYKLLGSALQDQADDILRTADYTEFKNKIDKTLEPLKKDNPQLGVLFMSYLMGKSPDDKLMDNIYSAMDLSGASVAGGVGKALLKKSAEEVTARNIVKDMAKSAATSSEPPSVAVASAAGDAGEAAVQKATIDIIKGAEGTGDPAKEAVEALPRFLQQQATDIEANPGHWGREIVNRLKEQVGNSVDNLTRLLTERTQVERLPAEIMTEDAVRRMKDSIRNSYPGISNNVLDISNIKWNSVTNTYSVDMWLGKNTGELFFNEADAQKLIDTEGLRGGKVSNQGSGLGYYIVLSKNLNENDQIIRDLWHEAVHNVGTENRSRNSITNGAFNFLRTGEDTFSLQENINRKIATYGQAELSRLIQGEAKFVQDVVRGSVRVDPVTGENIGFIRNKIGIVKNYVTGKTKQIRSEFERALTAAQEEIDPVTGQKGYFYKTPGELNDFYQRSFNRLPTYEETAAYFANQRRLEMDAVLREVRLYSNKARLGAEQHRVYLRGADKGLEVSPYFDGIQRNHFPGGSDDSVAIINDKGQAKLYHLGRNQINTKDLNKYKADVVSGKGKLIEIYDKEQLPLKGLHPVFDEGMPRYVLSYNSETKPLSYQQLPRRGGGHFEYDYDHYIKQARVFPERIQTSKTNVSTVHTYLGDTTFMPVGIRKMGHQVADILNDVRVLIKAGKQDEAKALFKAKFPMEMDFKEFQSHFYPKRVDGVLQPPRLDINEPFRVVPRGKSIIDLDKQLESRYPTTFRDGTRSGSLARQFQVQYTGSRDAYGLFTLKNEGTAQNPVFKYEPAKLVDPITSMNRGLRNIINTSFLDDYKQFSVNNWLREASSALGYTEDEIKSMPFWVFNNPKWKNGTDSQEIARLMGNRYKIQQFVGVPSKLDTYLHATAQTLADTLYSKWGPEGLGVGKFRLDPQWTASQIKDPLGFIRSMTFHAHLGLFSPAQLWVQAQTYALIFGISPRYAVMGTQAAMLHQWARINPAHLDTLDKLASISRFIPGMPGWKPGEFKEAFKEMSKTGFGHVGGEYALLDHTNKILNTGTQWFLNASAFFFREGELSTRYGAWYTAFKEFREENPVGRITNSDRARILQRADLLTSNMSRASASMLNNGALSFPAQFLTYQIRNAELFWGKRLAETPTERALVRARIAAVYTGLYGLAGAAGVTGLPISDAIRKYAQDNGYVVGEKYWSSILNEGGLSTALAAISGGGDIQKGTFYNIGNRYGNQGFQWFNDAMQSDKTLLSLVGGAAGSTMLNTAESLTPFFKSIGPLLRGEPGEFPLKGEDVVNAGKQIASVNAAWNLYIAATTGQWLSRNGAFVQNVSLGDALFRTAFGLTDQRQIDTYDMKLTHDDELAMQKEAFKYFQYNAHNAFRAIRDNDPQQYKDYMKRAFAYLESVGYPREKYSSAMSIAAKGYESMITSAEYNFYMGKDIPMDKRAKRRETYQQLQQLNQKREGQ